MSQIRELDPATVSRIAAGEVVERPASVVKELVENSLDADASQIEVEVDGDGTERIAVRDDGVGMSREEVELAVEQHTTSKIQDADDLDSGVSTLGFRGEALYTIGAVSRTTVTTHPREGDEAATELRLEGGDIESIEPTGRPAGTTVEVRDLFYNTPARREFLKAPSTEFGHVNRMVTQYALANPDIAIHLTHDDRETFATPGDGDRRSAVLAVYGREVAESMIAVDAESDGPLEAVSGYVSHPETTRSTRDYLGTYVNGRYVNDSVLREAVIEGYGNQLAADRFPFAVLDVTVPPEFVDANVHPRKWEVRFEDEDSVREAVTEAVHDALLENGLSRTRAPRGSSQPGDATITPEHGDSEDVSADSEPEDEDITADEPVTASGAADDDAVGDTTAPTHEASTSAQEGDAASDSGRDMTENADIADNVTATDTRPRDSADQIAEASKTGATSALAGGSSESAASGQDGTTSPGRDEDTMDADEGGAPHPTNQKFEETTENARLPGTRVDDADVSERSHEQLPEMRLLGQLHDTYIIGETPDGLVLVDQHAADERVRYEELHAALNDSPDSQALVSPARVEVTSAEAASFEATLPTLTDLGFEVTLEERTAVVSAVPAVFGHLLDADIVQDALASATTAAADEDILSAADALLADMACKPAIKGNTSLQEGDVTALLDRLDACEDPWACPHGRPVVIEFSEDELDARFERDYPGHQDRAPE